MAIVNEGPFFQVNYGNETLKIRKTAEGRLLISLGHDTIQVNANETETLIRYLTEEAK